MAGVLLQSTPPGNVGSGTATATFTTANLSAGSKLIAWVSVSSSDSSDDVTSVHDGSSNQFTQLASFHSNGQCWSEMWVLDTPAGDVGTKPTISAVTTSGTVFGVGLLVEEWSGLLAGNTSSILVAAAATNSGTTSPATGGAYSTSGFTGALLLAGYFDAGYSVTISGPTSSYSTDPNNNNASSDGTIVIGYKAATGGAETCSFTWTGSTEWGTFLVAIQLAAAGGASPAPSAVRQVAPGWFPGAPSAPGGEPFVPWPLWQGSATASLVNAPSPWELPPQYAPGWFPGAPAAPGGEPFTAWQVARYGVNTDSFAAAQTVTATGAAALTESKPLNAAQTVTATAAAALTEAKPLNAAQTATATGAAAETTAKPLNAAQTVTATAVASMTVVKAGVAPAPVHPPGWFPGAPGAPGAEPFTPWPPWTGAGVSAAPVDTLNAAQTVTATGAAALTEAKPVNAASTVTATAHAALTTAKPLNAAQTAAATAAAAETTAKPLNAAQAVTATAAAALTDVAGLHPLTAPPRYAPGWFPGAPGLPVMEPFNPWPPRWSQNILTIPAKQGTAAVTITLTDTVSIATALAGSVGVTVAQSGSVTIGNTL